MKKFNLIDRLRIPTYDNPKHMKTADLFFNPAKCKQCGICIKVCPGGCLVTDKVTKKEVWQDMQNGVKAGLPRVMTLKGGSTLCIACFCCGAACPHGAISIKRNFNPKYFYKRLTQTEDMRYPKRY
ncbi:MAG TPA: 4Fe-4S binding protein [Smithella sp.]|nr:4Fe-4S binding protein [Smithella sp.]